MTAASRSYLLVAIAAGAVFAIGLGIRQAQPLFISAINSHTAVGYAIISLAFGIAQLDRKSTRLNSSHLKLSRMPSSA